MERHKPACWPEHRDCTHREYIGRRCTLNGHPATVQRTVEGYACIAPLDYLIASFEFSWTAVYNIFENRGGRFTA